MQTTIAETGGKKLKNENREVHKKRCQGIDRIIYSVKTRHPDGYRDWIWLLN